MRKIINTGQIQYQASVIHSSDKQTGEFVGVCVLLITLTLDNLQTKPTRTLWPRNTAIYKPCLIVAGVDNNKCITIIMLNFCNIVLWMIMNFKK